MKYILYIKRLSMTTDLVHILASIGMEDVEAIGSQESAKKADKKHLQHRHWSHLEKCPEPHFFQVYDSLSPRANVTSKY